MAETPGRSVFFRNGHDVKLKDSGDLFSSLSFMLTNTLCITITIYNKCITNGKRGNSGPWPWVIVVISSVSMNNGDQIREYIVVLLNGFSGDSEEEIRKKILKKYDENTFNSICFSQGLSELDGLQVDVYEDKTGYQNGEKIFNFEYPEK